MPAASSQLRHLAAILGFVIAVGPMSVDVYLPAFEQIAHRFGAEVPQLTLASYFAGFAVGQLVQGVVSDRLGRRTPLLAGLLLFIFSCLGCAVAQSAASLCTFRVLAAFGAAASIVIPRATVRDLGDGPAAAGLMSDALQVMSVAPVIAPAAGGLLLTLWSWRVIFVAAAVYGLMGLYLVQRHLPETLPTHLRTRSGPRQVVRLWLQVARDRSFFSHACIGAFAMAALFAYLSGAPSAFMVQDRLSAQSFSLVLACLGLVMIGLFRINGWVARRRGPDVAISMGIGVWLVSGVALCLLSWMQSPGALEYFSTIVVFLAGYCFIPSNAQVAALAGQGQHAGTATSMMSVLQYVAGAIAGSLCGLLGDGTGRPMAGIILACALGAAVVARFRPRLANAVEVAGASRV